MRQVLKIASRNLMRYRRRTFLTAGLIALGTLAVLLFIGLSGAFKAMMVGQITDSMLGHLQIHRKGYVASMDNLPLNLMMKPAAAAQVEQTLGAMPAVEASSPRIKFGAMFSNFDETTAVRLNAVEPAREVATAPQLPGRVIERLEGKPLLEKGTLLVPELVARGMKVKPGDTVVIVATNQDGAVNGQTFVVQGIVEGISGPGGRDGYMHIEDARALLRLADASVSEYAVRLKDPASLPKVVSHLEGTLGQSLNQQGKPAFEIHDWKKLSPFASIAGMIDLMALFIQVMLVAIVLISVMNVMVMAVYERLREIGTLSAIGTPPRRILGLFVAEGLMLGLVGSAVGTTVSLLVIALLRAFPIGFAFGRQENLLLKPEVAAGDVAFISLLVLAVGVLAALQPAWKASRMDPIAALRAV